MAVLGAWGWGAGNKTFYSDSGWTIDASHTLSTLAGRRHLNPNGYGGECALVVDTNLITTTPLVSTTARWFHAYIVPKNTGSPTTYVLHFLRSGGATFWVRVNSTGTVDLLSGTLYFAATLLASSGGAINPNVGHWFAIYANVSASGEAKVYVDGALVVSFTGNTQGAGSSDWDQVALAHNGVGSGGLTPEYCISDIIITDEGSTSPRPELFTQVIPVGGLASGNLTGNPITGASRYQNIDEGGSAGAVDNVDYNEGTAISDEDLYTTVDPTLDAASIAMVNVWGWAERSGAITQAQLSVKPGSTVYYQTAVTLPASGWQAFSYILETDPDTAAAWTDSALNSLEIGVKFS